MKKFMKIIDYCFPIGCCVVALCLFSTDQSEAGVGLLILAELRSISNILEYEK